MTEHAPGRILDALTFDGGWLTTTGLNADMPDLNPKVIARALYRLRDRGLVVGRSRPQNEKGSPRVEWKAKINDREQT